MPSTPKVSALRDSDTIFFIFCICFVCIGYLARKTEVNRRLRKTKFQKQCKLLWTVYDKYPALANDMVYQIKLFVENIDEQLKKHDQISNMERRAERMENFIKLLKNIFYRYLSSI